ncbi:STP1 protein [Plasmodium malariae]|uniref:STP1 protein n=1 Tax=Plasmodium malariae TaxID=5858 RepID=A0A1A8WY17_PLAMA|nr:STP1 protein [Plasmodium malariae]
MEKCFPKISMVYGFTYFRYYKDIQFKQVVHHITNKINDFILNKDKEPLKNVCLYLSNYLIDNKTPPYYYTKQKAIWEKALNVWLNPYYKQLDKLGGCPLIMDENGLEILKLKYEVDDFCEKRNTDLTEINRLKQNSTYQDRYSRKCEDYNIWIDQRERYFKTKEYLIKSCYERNQTKKNPNKMCNIMDSETFKKQHECTSSPPVAPDQGLSKEKSIATSKVIESRTESLSTTKDEKQHVAPVLSESETQPQFQPEKQSNPEKDIENEAQTKTQATLHTEDSPRENVINHDDHSQHSKVDESEVTNSGVSIDFKESLEPPQLHTEPGVSGETEDLQIITSPSGRSNIATYFSGSSVHPKIPGLFKKKKRIKRRYVKILKILIPSHSGKKIEFLTHDYTDNSTYDSDEIVKKIKINEHNTNKNVNESKQKKNRYKTIIDVHMEVLEENKNKEWEYKKKEFLEICLELIAKGEYTTYRNLNNDELMENVQNRNDIEKQKILWNKWIDKHRNLSDKFKKEDWFNTLKNDWKKEHVQLKRTEELKNNFSNEIQNMPFSKKEKTLWKQWITKNILIINKYIEHDSFIHLTDELQNVSDEYENEETKNDFPLNNIGELPNKDYQRLYEYIKTKLLTKLCILVLMSVLEECKKGETIENRETYLDNSITEFKEKKNSDNKSEVIENIYQFNLDFLENKENLDYTANDNFRKEMENWIKEENIYINSMKKENNTDKNY